MDKDERWGKLNGLNIFHIFWGRQVGLVSQQAKYTLQQSIDMKSHSELEWSSQVVAILKQ